VHDWVRADLAADVPAAALEGAAVVVHAAAETAGGFEDHERNTVGATRRVLRAMTAARVRRLVYVSSISVLRPPGPFWERQSERTPRARRPERLGPYAWGKCAAEELVVAADAREEVEARIVRPAALVDWRRPEVPGLVGRRVFGRWVLGLGRPGLPVAVCDVRRAGAVVAWCADRFADAPPIVNLVDPAIRTRGQLLGSFRDHGWRGAVLWVPISLVAGAATTLGVLAALVLGEGRRPLSVWAILRPRRYDTAVAATVIHAADLQAAATGLPAQAPVRVARARG
jgi:nucleoside-diphosphate-sugar epimerase